MVSDEQLEEKVLRYVLVDTLKNELRAAMKKEEDQDKQTEEENHEEKFRRQMKEDLEIEKKKKKLEIQKNSYEITGEIVREERYKNVKLPKSIITKFDD